jgi:hypothetical protein
MTTLYELADEYTELMEAVQACDDIVELQPLLDRLNEADSEFIAKVDSIAALVNWCAHMAHMAEAERQRLAGRKFVFERKADRLKQYIQECMTAKGCDKVTGQRFTVGSRACPPSVEVMEQMAVPQSYLRTKTSVEVDKAKILDEYKATGSVPAGVRVLTDKKTVTIR